MFVLPKMRAQQLVVCAFVLFPTARSLAWLIEAPEQPKSFAPGIVLDWKRKTVEVESQIVFREGPLELFACSPRSREHESIIAIQARPLHVFQAMGLIGLEPGQPLKHDREKNHWLPPTGQPLDIFVRYSVDDIDYTVPTELWMVDAKTGLSPQLLPWVFAGSTTTPEGAFGADLEGTIVTVVDFQTAIIALNVLHTSENEQLWLKANTPAIPPLKSKCTLLIRGKSKDQNQKPLTFALSDKGCLLDRTSPDKTHTELTADACVKTIRANPHSDWFIEVPRGVSPDVVRSSLKAFQDAGFDRRDIVLRPILEAPKEAAGDLTPSVPRP